MKLIKGDKSYSKELIIKNSLEKHIFTGFMILLAIVYLAIFVRRFEALNSESFIILFSMLLGVLLFAFFLWMNKLLNRFLDKKDSNINVARFGEEGEKKILNKLEKILDDNYYVYPNFKIPGRKFDVDFLIIGKKGLIAMEVKNSSNLYSFFEKEALRIKGTGYTQEITKLIGNADPRIKLKNHCKSLDYYLYSIGLRNVKARKVLVFVNSSINIEGKSGIYIVKNISGLDKYFESLTNDERFSPEYCANIVEKINNSLKKNK